MHILDDPFILLHIATILKSSNVLYNCLMVFSKLRKYIKDQDLQIQLYDYMTTYHYDDDYFDGYIRIYGKLPNGNCHGEYYHGIESNGEYKKTTGVFINDKKQGMWISRNYREIEFDMYDLDQRVYKETYYGDVLLSRLTYKDGSPDIYEEYRNDQLIEWHDYKAGIWYKWYISEQLREYKCTKKDYYEIYIWEMDGSFILKYQSLDYIEILEYHWTSDGTLIKMCYTNERYIC